MFVGVPEITLGVNLGDNTLLGRQIYIHLDLIRTTSPFVFCSLQTRVIADSYYSQNYSLFYGTHIHYSVFKKYDSSEKRWVRVIYFRDFFPALIYYSVRILFT